MTYPRRPNDLRAYNYDSDSDSGSGQQISDIYGHPIPQGRLPPQGRYSRLDNPAPSVYGYPYHETPLDRNPPRLAPLQPHHRYGFPVDETPRYGNAPTQGRRPAEFNNEDSFSRQRLDNRGFQPQYQTDNRGFSPVDSSDDGFSGYGTDDDSIGAGLDSRDLYVRGVAGQRGRGAGAFGGGFGGAGRGRGGRDLDAGRFGHDGFRYQGGQGGGRVLGPVDPRRNPSHGGSWLDDSDEEEY